MQNIIINNVIWYNTYDIIYNICISMFFSNNLSFSGNHICLEINNTKLLVYVLINLLLWKCSYGPWEHFRFSWKSWIWLVNISQISVFSENTVFHFVFVNGKFHHVQTDDKGFYFLDITLYFLDIDIPISHSGHIPHGQRINRSWRFLFSCMGLRGCTRINISWEFEFSYNLNQDFTISAGMWSLELWFWVVREWTFPGNVHSGAK